MTNYAAVMPTLGTIEISDVGDPTPGPRDAVVKMEAVGVCGSDTAYFTVGYVGDYLVNGPIILGHECAGVVVEVGTGVTGVRVGDRVAIEPGRPCRDCRECMAGRYHLCPDLIFFATPPYDGSLQQYMAVDERQLFVLPDTMSFEDGALCEPLSVGIWACHRAGLQPGDSVLVTGAGPVGIMAAQAARAFGAADVTITDTSDWRIDFAARLGFTAARAGESERNDFDVLLECSGAPTALADGVWRLRPNGRAAMVGMPKQDVTLALSRLNVNELTIGLVNRYGHTWPTAISLIAGGRVDVSTMVTQRFRLDQTVEALLNASQEPASMKAMIAPQQVTG
ncbi:NAD(P)-dependent alcohol dehydrogenase [Nakamurella lactea]|uniref:NAD(P)-dependent alcohol dehydrogenase n=1 Tax=Nakamurella lactea TaxID=459515 RepID=UPI000421E13A|nr:NAD(P)-dependent alcohol dehydrogenase [Nakamurella lactea]